MKKVLSFTICLTLLIIHSNFLSAQTALPTSWSFNGSAPVGWTPYNTGLYATYAHTDPACRLAATGSYVQIYFDDVPGTLMYWLSAATASDTSYFQGTFTIEEGPDTTNMTIIRQFVNNAPLVYTQYTDYPQKTSRYIRFYFTNKVSGSNIGLDDVVLTNGVSAKSITVKYLNNVVNDNSTFVTGNKTQTIFKIINYGVDSSLVINNYTISGPDSANFSIVSMPAKVNLKDSSNFTLKFVPSGNGSRFATLKINSNDHFISPYVINIYAIAGNYATAPTAQPVNLTFSGVKSYAFNVSFSGATPSAEQYLILKKKGQPITETPTNGSTYNAGDYIGNAEVDYITTRQGDNFIPENIVANTKYYFAVFSFNGPSGYENYLTSSPLSGSITTLPNMIGTYYTDAGIDSTTSYFLSSLHSLIFTHKTLYYSDYDSYLIDHFESRDTTNNQKVVTCVYSGYNYVYAPPFAWNVFNREHTYCESWMPLYTSPSFQNTPEWSDYHNLFPVEANDVNDVRSNYPLGIVKTLISQFQGSKLGLDSNGIKVFEPRDNDKGDAARAIFYMCLAYDGTDGNYRLNQPLTQNQNQNLLKKWNHQDPPDNWEIARNDYIYSIQNNRNPFIDHFKWADEIDFSTNSQIPTGIINNEQRIKNDEQLSIYPNPNDGKFSVLIYIPTYINLLPSTSTHLCILDVQGCQIFNSDFILKPGYNKFDIKSLNLNKGMYVIKVNDNVGIHFTKFIVN